MKKVYFVLGAFISIVLNAQIDTVNADNLKLKVALFKPSKASYLVYMEDSLGTKQGPIQIWERQVKINTEANKYSQYDFEWKLWMKDSLYSTTRATGLLPSFKPLTHIAEYIKRPKLSVLFDNNIATVETKSRKTKQDTSFKVNVDPHGFEFPMDLELFPLLPFKQVNQQFMMAFYEPGSAKSNYYSLKVIGKEDLEIVGGSKIKCWLLRIDYGQFNANAIFWISDRTREVLKMKEEFKGIYRHKIRLY